MELVELLFYNKDHASECNISFCVDGKPFEMICVVFQLKESNTKSTDLQHQLDKSKQQHQELQALQQSTNGKLREAQVTSILPNLHKH